MKDNGFAQKHLTVDAHANGSIVVGGTDVIFMDKTSVAITGDNRVVSILVKCGDTQIDLSMFPSLYKTQGTTAAYCVIPFPINNLTISVVNPAVATNVSYYGGSA